MKRRGPSVKPHKTGNVMITTLGRERFAKISAVEGIKLTEAAKKRAAAFDREGLPAAERIRAIVAAHRKA